MFAQFIRAKVADESAVWEQMDRWNAELRPEAEGFIGSTAGITPEGELVLVVRFTSEEQARRNSDRAEQGTWWAGMEKALAGPATFIDSGDVDDFTWAGCDAAGFVQIMLGHGDRERMRALMVQAEELMRRERPDILGGITLWHGDDGFVDVAYFTSEAEARAGESRELPEDGRALFEQLQEIAPVDEYLDLPHPRLT